MLLGVAACGRACSRDSHVLWASPPAAHAQPAGPCSDVRAQEKKKDAPTGDVEGASIEELNQKITTLEKEKNKEEEYRNYMQLERVSTGSPWPWSRGQLMQQCRHAMAPAAAAHCCAPRPAWPTGQNQCLLGDHQERD